MKKNLKNSIIHKLMLAIMIFSLFLVVSCTPAKPTAPTGPAAVPEEAGKETMAPEGRAVFTITDAAADMGAVTSVKVTIDSVMVHSAEEGWITVSSMPKTYDLLQLKMENSQALLADIQLKPDTYQQVRLDISKVMVTDAQGDHQAKLPSGMLKIVGELSIMANSTSTATFDFMVDESLHLTGKGEYILAPVVQLETKENAEVEISTDNKVKIKSGQMKAKVKVGMDADGNVGVGLGIKKDLDLIIEGGKIKIGALVSAAAKAKAEEKTEAKINASGKASSGENSAKANVSVSVSGY